MPSHREHRLEQADEPSCDESGDELSRPAFTREEIIEAMAEAYAYPDQLSRLRLRPRRRPTPFCDIYSLLVKATLLQDGRARMETRTTPRRPIDLPRHRRVRHLVSEEQRPADGD